MKLLADPVATPTSAPVDLTGYAKTTDLSQYATKQDLTTKGEISPIFDSLPVPVPLAQQPTIPNLGSLVANAVGTQMVNGGKLHSLGRTSVAPQLTWDSTFNVSPAVTPCKLRFAVLAAKPSTAGGVEVSINGATALTASNNGNGWTSPNQSLAIYTDGAWAWFEVAISAQATAIPVRVQVPTGQGGIPTLYAADAITSLTPTAPTGFRLIAMPSGAELPYKPSQLAAKVDIPPAFDSAPLVTRLTALETAPQSAFSRVADTAWFNTEFDPRYLRKVKRSTTTSLTLEYKQANGTVRSFSLTDFTTGFTNSGFWNGSIDPNGVTRFVNDAETVVVSWDGTSENLTIAVVTTRSQYLQIRKARINGQPLDWLPVYEPPTTFPIVSYKTETILDPAITSASKTYLQLTNVPAGDYLAIFRLTMNLTAAGSRHLLCGVGMNNEAVLHPTKSQSSVSITADTYTNQYPHVANGSTPLTLANPSNTVELKGNLYGTDSATGENVSHGHLTLIKL